VADNGEGFDAASSARLFERGFSTRREKKGGLGLHWCANSAAVMQGSLKLVSDGKGRGATAILTLQSAEVETSAAQWLAERQRRLTIVR
jgi:C4-dicarboxylate-specific signal transduction histidine kinase